MPFIVFLLTAECTALNQVKCNKETQCGFEGREQLINKRFVNPFRS